MRVYLCEKCGEQLKHIGYDRTGEYEYYQCKNKGCNEHNKRKWMEL